MLTNKIAGVLAIILGFKVLLLQDFSGSWASYSFSDFFFFIPVSLSLFYVGFLFLKSKRDLDQGRFSKCPNCKEIFDYNGLKNGKCKNCDDVDTIDLEEYYIKYPEELEENS